MAYFSNSTDGAYFEAQCSRCKLNDATCPIAAVQFNYNYDAVNNEVATKILGGLVRNDGTCLMRIEIDKQLACDGGQKQQSASNCNLQNVSGSVFIEKPIPDKMLKAKDFVSRYTNENNKPPSYGKIAKHFGISRTAAYYRMKYFRELMSKTDR